MSELLSLYEKVGRLYASATAAELMEDADMVRLDQDDGSKHFFPPTSGAWEYQSDLPIDLLFSATIFKDRKDAKAWLSQEIVDFKADDLPERAEMYEKLLTEDICQPIVLSEVDGVYRLWDGWHRTAAAMAKGSTTIRAIVGRRPTPPAPQHAIKKNRPLALRTELYRIR